MDGTVWVILPTYDEAENLEAVVGGIRASLPEAQILVVDDNSPDGTGAARRGDWASTSLHRPGKAGLGAAYIAGFAHALDAGAGYVVEMDADLCHDPADLPRLLEPALDGADLVLGSRYVARRRDRELGPGAAGARRASAAATRGGCSASACAT